ncbi:MAG: metallophosphoesterase [Candidatus Dojkabacteria bacterium]
MEDIYVPETEQLPPGTTFRVISDAHLGKRRVYEGKLDYMIGLVEKPGIMVLNGDIGDYQFGAPGEIIGRWERLFNAIADKNKREPGGVRINPGNHDPFREYLGRCS